MLSINVERFGGLSVIDCKGRIVRSESVFELRDTVMAQASASTIALDLYEVQAIGGAGLGMLAFLQRWANDHAIELKLFTPSKPVVDALDDFQLKMNFDIPSLPEMMTILSHADGSHVDDSHMDGRCALVA
jgi:anti-anti-sigma regulatory factor